MVETYEPMQYLVEPSYQTLKQENHDLKKRHTQLCAFIRDQEVRNDELRAAQRFYIAKVTELEKWKHEALSFHGDGIRPGHIDKGDEHHAAELALIRGLDGKPGR